MIVVNIAIILGLLFLFIGGLLEVLRPKDFGLYFLLVGFVILNCVIAYLSYLNS